MSMQAEALRKFIGKPAKDTYGRYVGYVVGISCDPVGQLTSVGIDEGHGRFEEYPDFRILMDNESLIAIPTWKIETQNFRNENSLTQRRFQALDELMKDQEIPSYVYDELCKHYKESLSRLDETHKVLVDKLTKKVEEIDRNVRSLEKFLGNLKLQHKTGEMSDEIFAVASEYLTSGIKKSLQEKKDILDTLKTLSTPTSTTPRVEKLPQAPLFPSKSEEDVVKPQEPSGPITVRLRMSES